MKTIAKRNRDKLVRFLEERNVWGPGIATVVNYLYEKTDFFYAPASTIHHGSYPGGLFDHSFNVIQNLIWIGDNWSTKYSPYLVGLLHDITKANKYKPEFVYPEDGDLPEICYHKNSEWQELSPIHGEDSLIKAKEIALLSEEEELCIRFHMGAYETGDWAGFDRAIRKYPNVLWTHTADMYAAKVLEG